MFHELTWGTYWKQKKQVNDLQVSISTLDARISESKMSKGVDDISLEQEYCSRRSQQHSKKPCTHL